VFTFYHSQGNFAPFPSSVGGALGYHEESQVIGKAYFMRQPYRRLVGFGLTAKEKLRRWQLDFPSGWGADDATIKANYRQETTAAMDRRRCPPLAAVR